jgi:hypothetical protein
VGSRLAATSSDGARCPVVGQRSLRPRSAVPAACTGNRCTGGRSCRSRPTVRVEVICSHRGQLNGFGMARTSPAPL